MVQLFKNLAAFQQECPVIHKGTKGFNYTYADLSQILTVINPLLKKHNLGFTQLIMEDKIKTILFETKNGEFIESFISIPQNVKLNKMNEFQVLGSAITYLRRYALSSILGIVTDKDTDASGEQEAKKSVSISDIKKEISGAKVKDELVTIYNKYINEFTNGKNPELMNLLTATKNKLNG
jgi:hypothetical protein